MIPVDMDKALRKATCTVLQRIADPSTSLVSATKTENGWELIFKVRGTSEPTTTDHIWDAEEVQPVEGKPRHSV